MSKEITEEDIAIHRAVSKKIFQDKVVSKDLDLTNWEDMPLDQLIRVERKIKDLIKQAKESDNSEERTPQDILNSEESRILRSDNSE